MRKILIANRGEVAVRVIRACREMGIESVAVFSDVDRTSAHVLLASEAYPIGPAPSSDSYLRGEKILEVAKEACADSIHPGYGFLSENAEFAAAVMEAGLTWIGPPPEAIALMGDKVSARHIALESGVSVIPGSNSPVRSVKEARDISQSIGFPILLKAVGGGGGKGMRIVTSAKELSAGLRGATAEAGAAFADDRIFVEKCLPNPRHIEIQVVADMHGNIVALTERECSIQRRYQKIIEESPSTFINRNLWTQMADHAKKITLRCHYVGPGTVEFLVDEDHNIYFLEMNTRLQVEHPVTEMITGVDLVREQIRVADGKELSIPLEAEHRGHAIECRIYAEDGFANFLPSTGTIVDLEIPGGPAVRFDHAIRLNQEITPFYDPLLGKLITWGQDRTVAIRRMKGALEECRIVGVDTTIPFCYGVLCNPRFTSGHYNTNFIAEELRSLEQSTVQDSKVLGEIASFLSAACLSDVIPRRKPDGRPTSLSERWKTEKRKEALQ